MLLFKDGYFHGEGVMFEFPEGFYYDNSLDQDFGTNICGWSPDKTVKYQWQVIRDKQFSTEEALLSYEKDNEGVIVWENPCPVELDGLLGHKMSYAVGNHQYHELRLQLDRIMQFVFLVYTRDRRITDVVKSADYQRALMGIHRDNLER